MREREEIQEVSWGGGVGASGERYGGPDSGLLSGLAVDTILVCNYSNYMTSRELKVTRIGNSRGVRLPAESLKRYRIGETVVMEERSDGILLRPTGPAVQKLSWKETAEAMGASGEDWSEWDAVQADGLDHAPWEPAKLRRVAEPKLPYGAGRKRGKHS